MKNIGKKQYRFEKNPLEKRFANELEIQDAYEDTVSKILYDENGIENQISSNEREIIATTIQWLATSKGLAFIYNALSLNEFEYFEEFNKHISKIGFKLDVKENDLTVSTVNSYNVDN